VKRCEYVVVSALPILSFPLRCASIIGPAIFTPLIGEAQRIKKTRKLLLVQRICPTLPMGSANIPSFAFRHRMPRSANNNSCGSYIASLYWGYVAGTASLILSGLAYNLGSTDWKQKKVKTRWRLPKTKK
jgi:hypothetical protein